MSRNKNHKIFLKKKKNRFCVKLPSTYFSINCDLSSYFMQKKINVICGRRKSVLWWLNSSTDLYKNELKIMSKVNLKVFLYKMSVTTTTITTGAQKKKKNFYE